MTTIPEPEYAPIPIIEEDWHWDKEASEIVTRYPDTEEWRRVDLVGKTCRTIVETDMGCYPPTLPEALLIAQAPAMARILLSEDRWHHAECISCGGHRHQGGCAADCPIEKVLRAAGLLGSPT